MAASIYQIIPLRRVPARFSVLDYDLPASVRAPQRGEIVKIPFGKTTISGVVWAKGQSVQAQGVRRKNFQTTQEPQYLTFQQCALVDWISQETFTPLPVVAMGMLATPHLAASQKTRPGTQRGILAGHLDERHRVIQQFAKQQQRTGTTVVFVPALAYAETWRTFFPNESVVIHGKLSDVQKRALLAKAPRIAVVTHVGLSIPWRNLQHIVIDQADDDGYFAFDQAPRIDVRRAIQQLAKISGAALTLIARWQSPTLCGLFPQLPWRGQPAAAYTIIDRNGEDGNQRRFPIAAALLERVSTGRTLWLVHRRSAAGQLRCADCEAVIVCPKCGDPMRVEDLAGRQELVCQKDRLRQAPPESCPSCKGVHFTFQGKGVSTIAKEIRAITGKDVGVVDAKQKPSSASMQHVVSTTAIANYPEQRFDRVVVVRTESFFTPGQYRAAEELHNVLVIARQHVQRKGEFYCQTFQPETVEFQHDTAAAKLDIANRKSLHYPPFGTLFLLQARVKLPQVSPTPLPQEKLAHLPGAIALAKRWLIRCSPIDRATTSAMIGENLHDSWEVIVDPPRIPQD